MFVQRGHELDKVETIGQMLWKGKVFYRDERLLRNMIQDRKLLKKIRDEIRMVRPGSISGVPTWGIYSCSTSRCTTRPSPKAA